MENIKKYTFKLTVPKSVNALYNSRYNPKTHKSSFYMNTEAKDVIDVLIMEIRAKVMSNGCPNFVDKTVIGELIAYNINKRRDLNNLHKILWDCFEKCGIIDNDKNMVERSLQRAYDDSKEQYLIVNIYEATGMPSIEDIVRYFYWVDKEELISYIKTNC